MRSQVNKIIWVQQAHNHTEKDISDGGRSYIETGTAAAVTITTGFKPRYVKVMNEDGDAYMEWYEGMADAEAMKLVGDTTPAVLGRLPQMVLRYLPVDL